MTAAVAAISALLLIYSRMNSAWLIFAAGLVGLAATR
jgi:chromate transport protein ChrA